VDGARRVIAQTACTETKVFPGFPHPSNLAFARALARVAQFLAMCRPRPLRSELGGPIP
jgi:hypothetical protein